MGCQKGKLGFNEYNFPLIGVLMFVVIGFGGVDGWEVEGVDAWEVESSRNVLRNGRGSPLMVGLTLIEAAAGKGAVCLDGSLPGYHLDRGSGSGRNNWLVHFEGGGWCNNMRTCVFRKTTRRGSSRFMEKVLPFTGILSNNRSENPDFYNWNRVKLRYCDGASFTGDVKNATNIYFRGQRIWQAAIEDLLSKGMKYVDQALLSGCSAGGLSSILHCDEFRELLPKSAKIKCFSDAGFFLDTKDISGASTTRTFFEGVVTLQDAAKNLPRECTSRTNSSQCFFPQYLLPYIRTPLFILNAAYDAWQVSNSVAPGKADPTDQWHYCKRNIANCTSRQLEILQGFRMEMLSALKGFKESKAGGMFINSCFLHCQSEVQSIWYASDSPRLQGKTIAESVGDWYFKRKVTKFADCAYPCDGTCPRTPIL